MKSRIRDIMTTSVVAVRKGASFKEMVAHLREQHVSAFPVIDDDNTVIGVVSEADLLLKEALDGGHAALPGMINGLLHRLERQKAEGITADDLMTSPAVTIGPDEPAENAARMMYLHRVKRLPVTDSAGRLLGIISRADVLAVFDRPDEEIRREITEDVLHGGSITDPAAFTVTVKDGIATIAGAPETSAVGHDIIDRSRHVQGVVTVRDHLAYPPAVRPVIPEARF
jgi:CBS-domain-containing membrane protein